MTYEVGDGIRIAVSSEWTSEERAKVASVIQLAINSVNEEDAKQRETIRWMSPSRKKLAAEKAELEIMIDLVEGADAKFLELNRRNFGRFLSSI